MTSPLQLKSSHLTGIEMWPTATGPFIASSTVECEVDVARRGDSDREWKVALVVRFGGSCENPTAPVRGRISMEGEFSVDPHYPSDQVHRLVSVNGPSILFGAIREVVASLSSRTVEGPYFLPSVSFLVPSEISPPVPDATKA